MRTKLALSVVVLLASAGVARAQLPAARLSTVFPPGGQPGTSVDVTVTGTDLDDLAALHFPTPGIVAEPKLDPAGKPVPNAFVVRIGRDVRPGAYDCRAVGRFGVTNPRAFVVDREPHAVAKPGNNAPGAAAELALDAGVYAAATANAAQFYRVNLKANQRVFVDADAAEIDSRMEPVLVLLDAAGREVARDDRAGVLDVTPPADGAYVVGVHDVLYRGGPEYFYRLRAHTTGRVEFALPPAIQRDGLTPLTLFGRGLPGGTAAAPTSLPDGRPLDRLSMTLLSDDEISDDPATSLRARWFVPPAAAMLDGSQRYAFAGASGPLMLARAAAPLVAEQAQNDEPAQAQKVTAPVELYGQFYPRGDRDWLSFDAKKGDALWIEVVSNRLLDFTDPVVVVQRVTKDDKGVEQAVDVKEAYEPENVPGMPREFYAAHRDPAFRFAVPEDGTYRVLVRDLFNEGADDPRRVYRISIAPAAERQDVRLVAWPHPPEPMNVPTTVPAVTQTWGSNLRPGGVMPVSVLAFRTGGFAGEITLSAENLPPGVTCPPVVMNGGVNAATLMLVAEESAKPWVGAVRIVGTAGASPDARFRRAARAGTFLWTVPDATAEPLRARVAQELVVAVTAGEAEPIAVAPAEQKVWEDSVAGRIEVPLKLTRRAGYNDAVALKPASPVATIAALPAVTVAAGANEAKLVLDVGALQLPVGTHTVHLQATSTAAYDRDPAKRTAAQASKEAADKATPDLAAAAAKAKESLAAAKTPEEKDAATKAVAAAEEKVKQNEAAKAALAEQVKALSPKPTLAYAYSPPIQLKITAAPITLAATVPADATAKPGGKLEVPVTVTRLYGFAGAVDLAVTAPQGVPGITVATVNIPAAATTAPVTIQLGADAKPGEYTLTLAATLKQNDRPVKVEQPLRIKVVAP